MRQTFCKRAAARPPQRPGCCVSRPRDRPGAPPRRVDSQVRGAAPVRRRAAAPYRRSAGRAAALPPPRRGTAVGRRRGLRHRAPRVRHDARGARRRRRVARAEGRLLSRPLDMDRPLWRMARIDGLQAAAWRSSVRPTTRWSTASRRSRSRCCCSTGGETAAVVLDPAPAAGAARVAQAGFARAARTAGGALRARRPPRARCARPPRRSARPRTATALSRSLTHRREVAFADAPLEDAARRRRAGTARPSTTSSSRHVAGAGARAQAPRRPPGVDQGARPSQYTTGEAGDLGNDISFVPIELPVGETDPPTVLRLVRDATKACKGGGDARPLRALAQAADVLPAAGRRAITRAAARAAAFNLVVSNVPGPPQDLTLLGRRLTAHVPGGPASLHGHALSIGALSYAGRPARRHLRRRRGAARRRRRRPRPRAGLRRAARRPSASPAPTPWRARAPATAAATSAHQAVDRPAERHDVERARARPGRTTTGSGPSSAGSARSPLALPLRQLRASADLALAEVAVDVAAVERRAARGRGRRSRR